MKRVTFKERDDWRETAENDGFDFHTFPENEQPIYWDESAAYEFEAGEVEKNIEDPTDEIHGMCLEFVERAVKDEKILERLRIPAWAHAAVRDSWERNEGSMYGRMDFSYSGNGPAKLLEYNADTPTSIFEAAYFQWGWLEEMIQLGRLPAGTDQYNSMHERLIDVFRLLPIETHVHFACCAESPEDFGTIRYLADCCSQAGHSAYLMDVTDIHADSNGNFLDQEGRPIVWLFKLYAWEWMFRDFYMKFLPTCDTNFIEPAWKSVLSNKGMLPYLWEMFPNHPNLLATFFEDDPKAKSLSSYARKPIFAREGANITLVREGEVIAREEGLYGDDGYIIQELSLLPEFGHGTALIGSWVVNNQAAGMGVREENNLITANNSRFLPHYLKAGT